MYTTGILYEVEKSQQAVNGAEIPIRLISALAPSITIYGAEQPPDNVLDMADIASDISPIIIADWYSFGSLPRFITFVGTTDDIEVSNARLVDKGAIT